jgi:hypothetical protein
LNADADVSHKGQPLKKQQGQKLEENSLAEVAAVSTIIT